MQLAIAMHAGHKLRLACSDFFPLLCVIILVFNRKINYIDFFFFKSVCIHLQISLQKRTKHIGIHKFYAISVKIGIYTL